MLKPFPLSETRDYVKKVMSNSVLLFRALFNGKPDSLKTRLGVVASRSPEAFKDADLP